MHAFTSSLLADGNVWGYADGNVWGYADGNVWG